MLFLINRMRIRRVGSKVFAQAFIHILGEDNLHAPLDQFVIPEDQVDRWVRANVGQFVLIADQSYVGSIWLRSDIILTDGLWYHVAGVYDNKSMKVYVGMPDYRLLRFVE